MNRNILGISLNYNVCNNRRRNINAVPFGLCIEHILKMVVFMYLNLDNFYRSHSINYTLSALFWNFTQRRLLIPYRRFGTTHWSHFKKTSIAKRILIGLFRLQIWFTWRRKPKITQMMCSFFRILDQLIFLYTERNWMELLILLPKSREVQTIVHASDYDTLQWGLLEFGFVRSVVLQILDVSYSCIFYCLEVEMWAVTYYINDG
jgi:hypothetical protein